ncbi:hypothetical protein CHU98_g2946 [Xylaria longipes]|nr:hypothetical protein CHU98_g2946 [Xylaria longipes]
MESPLQLAWRRGLPRYVFSVGGPTQSGVRARSNEYTRVGRGQDRMQASQLSSRQQGAHDGSRSEVAGETGLRRSEGETVKAVLDYLEPGQVALHVELGARELGDARTSGLVVLEVVRGLFGPSAARRHLSSHPSIEKAHRKPKQDTQGTERIGPKLLLLHDLDLSAADTTVQRHGDHTHARTVIWGSIDGRQADKLIGKRVTTLGIIAEASLTRN